MTPTLLLLLCAAAAAAQPRPDAKSPGYAVLVRQHGRTVLARGYGVRDLRTFAPIDAKTNFRLASCTKQFTAMAVMLLVRDGRLRYEDRLTDVFPDFAAYGRAITVRHLLNHTSGLPDYEDLMGDRWTATRQIQDAEAFDLLKRHTAGKFAPGTSWSYSNSGYVVLGLIVAKVSGKPFAQFLQDRIFAPLHMDNTRASSDVPARAYGHSKQGDHFVETDQSPTSATLGDGGVYSNLEDLAKWDEALRTHALLSEDEMKPALTPARLANGAQPHWPPEANEDNLNPGKPVAYGFGWFLGPWHDRPRMWHFGTTQGFRTAIERFPKEELTVVVLSNRTDFDAAALALEASGRKLSEPRPGAPQP